MTAERSEFVAGARWRNAFDAVRRKEPKSPERAEQIVALLRSHEILAALDESVLTEMAHAMRETLAREGDALITQGEAGDHMYVVAEGTCAAYIDGSGGAQDGGFVCVATYEPGQAFGELALLYDQPRAATVRCTSRSALLYSLGRIAFRNLLSSHFLSAKVGLEKMLAQVPLLSALSDRQRSQLCHALTIVTFEADEYILERGAVADALYLILSGEVACHHGGEAELRLAEGAFFGESCLSHGQPYPASPGGREGQGGSGGKGSGASTSGAAAKKAMTRTDSSSSSDPAAAVAEAAAGADGPARRQAHVVAVGPVQCARLMASDVTAVLGPLHAALDRAYVEKVIASIELFDGLQSGERALLLSALTVRHVAAGEAIISQGEVARTFYVLKAGSVDVIVTDPAAAPAAGTGAAGAAGAAGKAPAAPIATLRGGEATAYFGERGLLSHEPAVATVLATSPCDLLCLAQADFAVLFEGNADNTRLLMRVGEVRDAERQAMKEPLGIAWSELQLRNVLGTGSFGMVRLALHRGSGAAYALKGMHKGQLMATKQVENVVNEKRILMRCAGQPFLMACHGAYVDTAHVYLLLELLPGGELFARLQKVGILKEPACAAYVAMVASALGFLGLRSIAHRDLKLENLMLDGAGYLKLVDFGFAKVIEDRTWTFCGTPDYLAPEIVKNAGHTRAVDWWALGVLTYEMLHGEPPFVDTDQMQTFKRIAAGRYTIGRQCSEAARHLIRRLLEPSPAVRLGMLANGATDVHSSALCNGIDVAALEARRVPPPFVPQIQGVTDTSHFDTDPGAEHERWLMEQQFASYLKDGAKHQEIWEQEFTSTTTST